MRRGGITSGTRSALLAWRRTAWGEFLAECLGTFVLICFGDGVVAMAVAALNQSGRGTEIFAASGDWLIIGWGWGSPVAFAVYVAGGVSGAHINPAVTLAFAVRRGFPWRKVPGYIAAQVVGAFLGALLVYIVYKAAIDSYKRGAHTRGDPDALATYSIFATFPAKYFGDWVGPFVDQSSVPRSWCVRVRASSTSSTSPRKRTSRRSMIGFVVVAIGLSFGANAGYAINPARDFGPRLFACFAGWGKIAIPGDYANVSTYLWIPIVRPVRRRADRRLRLRPRHPRHAASPAARPPTRRRATRTHGRR